MPGSTSVVAPELQVEIMAMGERINTLEARLRIWRDDYARSPDGLNVAIPVYQIENLIGKK